MEISISIIAIIAIWLIWSRFKINKEIKKAFEIVEHNKPVILGAALREVIGYCQRNNLEYTFLREEYLIVKYNEKVITIQKRGNFRMGESLFFIQ